MKPDDSTAQCGSSGEDIAVGRERHTEAGLDEFGFKAGGEGRMCRDRGNVSHEVLGTHRPLVFLTEVREQVGRDVRHFSVAIAPEGEYASATPVVMVKVGDRACKGERG